MRRTLLLLAAAPLVLAGCGDGSPDKEKVTPPSESMPDCSDVWVAGKILPDDYTGCVDAAGVLQVSEIKECTSIDESFTTFQQDLYAVLGQEIHSDLTSQEYRQAYGVCFGTDW